MQKLFFLLIAILTVQTISTAQDYSKSGWHIEAKNINPNNYYGVTLANGMVGLVSSTKPMHVQDVVLNGAYDYYQRGRVSNILKTFNHVNMDMIIGGTFVNEKTTSNYRQVLDMKEAKLITTFDVGTKATVKHTMMSLRHLPYTALTMVEITAKEDVEINPMAVIEAPTHLQDVRNLYAEIDRPHVKIPLMTSMGKSPSGKLNLAASVSFIFNEKHGSEPDLIHEDWDYNRHLTKFYKKLKKGETYKFSVVGSTVSSATYNDPLNEAERLTIYAALEGTERLLKRHNEAWAELWQSDILIEGDIEAQKNVHSMIYHLYSFARKGTALSLSPMGLSGLGYNGHVFWDTEIWMFPPLLMLQPDIAKSILEYRFERLEAAKQNAFSHGYDGAMFPWESSAEGSEDTPVWALTGPFQHHISGDIGWAAWKYYQVTGDKEWLKTRGYPMLKEIADFWCSRVERNGTGKYDINNVIGANEWEENIDNNAYTNGMAITVLRNANDAAKALGITPNPDWLHVAANIPILKFPDGTTRENATYDGVTIKQGDANLLAYPMAIITEKEQILKDLKYYEPRMAKDGPAMGFSVLATLYARMGETEKAYGMFNHSYQPNQVPPFGVLSETAGGTNPYFATGAGGTLQTLLNGFGGLDITDNGVEQKFTPTLPKAWGKLVLKGIGGEESEFVVEE
ncbi:MAG: glycoside hydrolase family 65 protein [Saprospiraceae bacterium]|nr:glycoside hydrolase family 65 protein [Saprospiraceae bacterium]